MKTNYDHIIEGGIEALADILVNHTCQSCSFQTDCKSDGNNLWDCTHGVILWLEQACEEPDSWVKWDEDAMKLGVEYWGCAESSCAFCPSKIGGQVPRTRYDTDTCDRAMDKDLILRAKKLRSAE